MHPELVHPDIKGIVESKGGLFDVAGVPGAVEMEANIGRPVAFINPSCGVERESGWLVAGVQKNYRGELCYSLFREGLGLTKCTHPRQICFL